MRRLLVDSNVVIDITSKHPVFFEASAEALRKGYRERTLTVNPVVWAEVAPEFANDDDHWSFFSELSFVLEPLTFVAARRAGEAHFQYRRAGGTRERTLPDFLIGAHAEVGGYALLTRDPERYRNYFPQVELVVPGRA